MMKIKEDVVYQSPEKLKEFARHMIRVNTALSDEIVKTLQSNPKDNPQWTEAKANLEKVNAIIIESKKMLDMSDEQMERELAEVRRQREAEKKRSIPDSPNAHIIRRGYAVKGDMISYVKTKTKEGVLPVEMARKDQIDSDKYMETLKQMVNQLVQPMGMDFDQIIGKGKQDSLDSFFY